MPSNLPTGTSVSRDSKVREAATADPVGRKGLRAADAAEETKADPAGR
jgi:hypothetical protein